MPQEIELKLKVAAHDPVRQRLRERGGRPLGRVVEINRIFDDAGRTLLAGGRGLRVRECLDEHGRRLRAALTYKGPKAPGDVKRREEIEFAIDDPAAAAELLAVLGYTEAVHFEKYRESWRLAGCEVELDEIPHLGAYVEIEGPDEACIRRVQEDLDLVGAEVVRRSYVGLLVDYCRRRGLPADAIRF
ncbi:MAG: class IV adenylate cyclase [Phycisphaerae bacterium]|jgi:adenylate cyclase class 2